MRQNDTTVEGVRDVDGLLETSAGPRESIGSSHGTGVVWDEDHVLY
ncbi:MAG: hypothetical protein AAGK03_20125 [Pseudomonadota bacterium]